MGRRRCGRVVALVGFSLMLALTALGPSTIRPVVPSTPPAFVAAAPTDARPSMSPTPHSALNLNASSPSGSFPPGEQFTASYTIQVPAYTALLGAATVRIPGAVVVLPSTPQTFRFSLSPVNVTVADASPVVVSVGPIARIAAPLSVPDGSVAVLSTQGLALMASWPFGGPTVEVRWHWTSLSPDGSRTVGNWSSWTGVVPALIATITNPAPHVWKIGGPYEICFAGPVGGRTFALNLTTANSLSPIDGAATTIPRAGPVPYCDHRTIPAAVSPQPASLRLWEYANVTFLLAIIPMVLVANPAGAGGVSDSPLPSTAPWALVGVVIASTVIVAEVGYLLLGGRPRDRSFQRASARGKTVSVPQHVVGVDARAYHSRENPSPAGVDGG